jgi:uncharacterized protein
VIDVNVHLSRWPFRRLPLDDTAKLVQRLKSLGVTSAWTGSYDAILHREPSSVNARLAEDCAAHGDGVLEPVGSLHLGMPGWEEDLRRCHDQHKMRIVRLYPSYHGYGLNAPAVGELLDQATQRKLVVQIVAKLEDERTQHPLVTVPPVELEPLKDWLTKRPQARVVLLNALGLVRGEALSKWAAAGPVWFETAMLEGVAGIGVSLKHLPADRLLMGTHAPFFAPEAAPLKLKESDLGEALRRQIAEGNAVKVLDWS